MCHLVYFSRADTKIWTISTSSREESWSWSSRQKVLSSSALTLFWSFSGGIFAVYSLLCRHAKLSLLPNHQAADEELSAYQYPHNCLTRTIPRCRRSTELLKRRKTFLLLLALFSASMVVSVAVLTPAISGNMYMISRHATLTVLSASFLSLFIMSDTGICSVVIRWRDASSSETFSQ